MSTEAPELHSNPLTAIHCRAKSDIGQRREENQDAYGIIEHENYRFYVVCDGMGGVKGGAVASGLSINTIKEYFKDKSTLTDNDICEAVSRANTAIFQQGANDPGLTGMGTTFVALGFVGTEMYVSSVGDSRAYRIRSGHVEQLTEDHTLVRELLRTGAINEQQAGNHPVSHMLTRSLGPAPTTEVDCTKWPDGPQRGDLYLLCSDGLYNMLGPEEFTEIVQSLPIEEAVEELISLANLRGGVDNITVILVRIGEEYPVGPTQDATQAAEEPVQEVNGAALENHENPQVSSSVKINEKAKSVDLGTEQKGEFVPPQEPSPHEQPKAESAPSGASPATRITPKPRIAISERSLVIAMIVGFPLALLFGYLIRSIQDKPASLNTVQATTTLIQPDFQIAEVATQDLSQILGTMSPSIRLPDLTLNPIKKIGVNGNALDQGQNSTDSSQHLSDTERIERRRQEIQAQIKDTQEKIDSFSRPISGKVGDTLKETTLRMDALARAVEGVRAKIDIATRALTIWYGRKKRLEGSDPVNLASEVAVSSDVVKLKKEAFEQATYAYLKEAEVLRYGPSDQAQERRVRELARSRSEARRDLVDAIKAAIDGEVANADRTIAEFTLKRERAEADMEQFRRTVEYVKILMGTDQRAKDLKRKELERAHDAAKSELEELELIAPEKKEETVELSTSSDNPAP